MAGISDLPVELFALCMLFLPLRDRVRVSHVSRLWRAIATVHPELWRQLSFHHQPGHRATFLSILGRAGGMQLDATWDCGAPALSGMDILETELPRVRSLTVKRHSRQDHHDGLLDRLLSHTLVSLEEFYLDSCHLFVIPFHWSGQGAPRLRKLTLGDFVFEPTSHQFPNLRVLRGALGRGQHPRTIFHLCPELTELELSGVNQVLLNGLSAGPIPTTLRRLRLLKSEGTGWTSLDYEPLLKVLGHMPDLFAASRVGDVSAIVRHYASHVGTPFRMTCHIRYPSISHTPSILQLRLENEGPHNSVFRSTATVRRSLGSVPRFVPSLQNLAHLECATEFFSCLLRISPTLPSLLSLTLVFCEDSSHGDPNYCPWEQYGHLDAPRLRALAVDTARVRPDIPFDAGVWLTGRLSATVRQWLRFDAPRLESASLYVSRSVHHAPAALSAQVFSQWVEKVFVGWRANTRDGLLETGTWYNSGEPDDT